MKMNGLLRHLISRLALGLALAIGCVAVRADYVISATTQGSTSATVRLGDTVTLDVTLDSDAFDEHSSAIFRLTFSAPGLIYQGYSWSIPYANGTRDDATLPVRTNLPLPLSVSTVAGAYFPSNVVDLYFDNVIPSTNTFSTGSVLQATFRVPTNYSGPSSIQVLAVPDTIALGLKTITSTSGPAFELSITTNSVVAPKIVSSTNLADGTFKLTISGQIGQSYLLQGSSNLKDWIALSQFTMRGGTYTYVDSQLTGLRIYRVNTAVLRSQPVAAQTDGSIRLTFNGPNNAMIVIQASDDMTTWNSLATNTFVNGVVSYSDKTATNSTARIYRAYFTP